MRAGELSSNTLCGYDAWSAARASGHHNDDGMMTSSTLGRPATASACV